MNLSDVFASIAFKELASVDLPHRGSNQHELNGTSSLRDFFETSKKVRGKIEWHYFSDEEDTVGDENSFTFYDSRKNNPNRAAEWRMYYYGDFLSRADEGDVLVLARVGSRNGEDRFFGLVFQKDSGWLRSAKTLFGFGEVTRRSQVISDESLSDQDLELSRKLILEELDIEVSLPVSPSDEDLIVSRFPDGFPGTREMSEFARGQVEVDFSDSDEALLRWVEREEQLFRALERVIVQVRLDEGFRDVDDFVSFSLSVQNRRKSRMGHALEHHLSEVFDHNGVKYSRQKVTEKRNKPDFLFPGIGEYRSESYSGRLTMLAAKSSCKERWRQILPEADRIPDKHLCTLDQAISGDQMQQMKGQRVTLVMPQRLLLTYVEAQRIDVVTMQEFVNFVLHHQKQTS